MLRLAKEFWDRRGQSSWEKAVGNGFFFCVRCSYFPGEEGLFCFGFLNSQAKVVWRQGTPGFGVGVLSQETVRRT